MKGMINNDKEIYNICLTPIKDVNKFNSTSERIFSYIITSFLSILAIIILIQII